MKRILILTSLLIFTGCTAATGSPTATPSPSRVPPVTFTPVPTITTSPTSTISPTASEIIPTPDLMDSPIVDGVLLSPHPAPDCQLPCWQGLRVGESDRDDIQTMFDEVFGFRGTRAFFKDPTLLAPIWIPDVPGTQADGYEWEFTDVHFDVVTVIDQNSGILQGIRLIYSSQNILNLSTFQQIIHELGPPDYYFTLPVMDINLAPPGSSVPIDIILFYNEGMAFGLTSQGNFQETMVGEQKENLVHFCLDSKVTIGMSYFVPPFTSLGYNDLPPLSEEWFSRYINPKLGWISGDEAFGISVSQFSDFAYQDPPCIDFK